MRTTFLVFGLLWAAAPSWIIAVDSSDAQSHFLRGELLVQEDKLDAAIKEYREAVQLSPDNPAYHFALGKALDRHSDLSEALDEYRIAQQLDPKSSDVQMMYDGLAKELKIIESTGIRLHKLKPAGDATDLVAVHLPDPTYSEAARRDRIEGKITLIVIVGADGRVASVRLWKGLSEELDRNALRTVGEWRFKPATAEGSPVAVRVLVDVRFRLFWP